MGRPLKIAHTGGDLGYAGLYGVVGGDTGTSGGQIQCRVKIGANAEDDGFIVRQKGSRKYLVKDTSGNTGVCTLVNGATGSLADGEMLVEVTDAATNTFALARFNNKFGVTYTGQGFYLTFGAASATMPPAGKNSGLYEIGTVASA